MLSAGWDGSTGHAPGFPKNWNVKYEGLLPMPSVTKDCRGVRRGGALWGVLVRFFKSWPFKI
jgi:hypothetical protein